MAASAGPALSREEVDRALARLGAERDAVESALLSLQDHPGLRLLDGAGLTGRTLERWSVVGQGLPLLWALFDRYSEALASARAVRARRAKPGGPELAELSELLTGDAVTVPGGAPDGPQRLGAPARLVERVSLEELMERMNSWYATVLEVVSAADAVWTALPARIDLLIAELRRVQTLAASLGVRSGTHPLGDDLEALDADLEGLRAEVRADPLALWRPARVPAQRGTVPDGGASALPSGVVDTERFDRAGRALDGVRQELENLLRLRDDAEERLQGVGDLLQRADATLAEARRARGEVLAKIAATEVPAVPGPASALRERIVLALELRQNGQWYRLAPLLDALEDAAAKELARARQSLTEVTQPLAVRAELRGRLDAYKAMAARLRVSEDPVVLERYEKARWLLWSAPCDLRAAAGAVARFQQALRPAPGEPGAGAGAAEPGGAGYGGGTGYGGAGPSAAGYGGTVQDRIERDGIGRGGAAAGGEPADGQAVDGRVQGG
ncbi:hypothetical protein [Kitasatospora purpeofusca]|uniref:hypothetical protein n=1 Tax=Kitasatospora purpeofusca TaxID=67352 RepID=UPI002259B1B6|nr:hypothetical protein [Kitasatospora purpeofusca]MCX4757579.1 hypothetical protein [Kitasatospora purpeofusca]WSR34702.1 hypothetical protein OG715_29310 [Kitasatospora purpeofusca]WSR42912.1 hypothetical protein OG196_29785 [Kitasatospora purpeofusca]